MKEYKYKVNGVDYTVNINSVEGNMANVTVNGVSYNIEMEKPVAAPNATPAPKAAPAPAAAPKAAPAPAPAPAPKAAPAPAAAPAGGKALKAPLPGVIKDIKVAVGDQVKEGQVVLILEAMKMENEINAECDGTITAISVNKDDSVLEGTVLLTIG